MIKLNKNKVIEVLNLDDEFKQDLKITKGFYAKRENNFKGFSFALYGLVNNKLIYWGDDLSTKTFNKVKNTTQEYKY